MRFITGAIKVGVTVSVGLLMGVTPHGARAQSPCQAVELDKLQASDAAPSDLFGVPVVVDGDTAVFGAGLDDDNGNDSGAAYVFRFDGSSWVQEAKLVASDGAADDWLGFDFDGVSISGDRVVIGAYGDGELVGAAYVFRYDGMGWSEEKKLSASDGAANDRFGKAVLIFSDTVVVGAWQKGIGPGAAYVFGYDGVDWSEEQRLLASDGQTDDWFGFRLALWGDTLVIGAPYDDDNGTNSGSAYIFRYNGSSWGEVQKIVASDGASGDRFGWSVAARDDTIMVGAEQYYSAGAGAVYVFRYDGVAWLEEDKLVAPDGAAYDQFGRSVVIGEEIVAVGAGQYFKGAPGAAYVFRHDGVSWVHQVKLLASDGAASDAFGDTLGLTEDMALVGAHADDDIGGNSGSVYVFRGFTDCNDNGALDICDMAGGGSADANGNGIPDECDDADGDGLLDQDEPAYGTDPLDPDTDDDGLLDGTEVDMALGTGCPDPIQPDSDDDTLPDGEEVGLGTDPCGTDSDEDGIPDAVDPYPTEPTGTSTYVEEVIRTLADDLGDLDVGLWEGPNSNANRGRRNALSNKANSAANAVRVGDYDVAIDILTNLRSFVDGIEPPPDWLGPSAERDLILSTVDELIELLGYM